MSQAAGLAECCSAWRMRLAPRTIRLGPWYAIEAGAGVFGGGGHVLVTRATNHGKVGSATKRSLRQRIATQHSVGHEETRMPCMSVRDSESRTRARHGRGRGDGRAPGDRCHGGRRCGPCYGRPLFRGTPPPPWLRARPRRRSLASPKTRRHAAARQRQEEPVATPSARVDLVRGCSGKLMRFVVCVAR